MPFLAALTTFVAVAIIEWLRGLACVLVWHPLKGVAKALHLLASFPVVEFALFYHMLKIPDGLEWLRQRYIRDAAKFTADWTVPGPNTSADPEATERLDRIRHPEKYRGRE